MNKICFAMMAACLAFPALAEEASTGVLGHGDAQAGSTKAATCVACHGQDGNSMNGEWPKLAGQHAPYLVRQLELFKSGGRENAIMMGMAAALSEQDMQDIAAYYQEQSIKPGVAEEDLAEFGGQLYRGGSPSRGIPACSACHGPNGHGNPLAGYPAIAGQHAQYLQTVLTAFRDGAVWGKEDQANAVMANVADQLTDREIEALASFLEGLH